MPDVAPDDPDRGDAARPDEDRPTLLAAGSQNSIGLTLGLLGDEWTLLILREAMVGARHYRDWMERLPISNSVLASRLARLTEFGLLDRVVYQQRPERFEYRLTKRGRSVWPILLGIWAWELSWVPDHPTAIPRMEHRECGAMFEPVLVCAACERPVQPRDIAGEFGPSGTWVRSVPVATTRRRSGVAQGNQAVFFPQTMALIGNRWSSALLGAAFRGARRFRDFEHQLSAPPAMVADRLRTFCELDVMSATRDAEGPDRAGYHLTDKGRAFFPVVIHTLLWGERWFRSPEGPAVVLEHRACGKTFFARFACSSCGALLKGNSIEPVPPA